MDRSPFGRLHPAARLTLLVAVVVTLTAFNDPAFVGPATLAVAVVAAGLCGAASALAKALPLAAAFVLLSVLLWPPFVKTGTPVFRFGFYAATDAGLRYGLAVGLRVVGMLFAGLAFLRATSPEEFSDALQTFRFPPAATVTITLAFRLVPIFFENTGRALGAQRARGMAFGKNFFSQTRRVLPLVVPVFLYSLRTVDQLATALELRGYRAGRRPARWPPRRVTAGDWLWPLVGATLVAAAVVARARGWGAVLPGRL